MPLGLRELFLSVSASWPEFRAGKTVDRGSTAYRIVVEDIPELLQTQVPKSSTLKVEGSAGLGNVAATPWVAAFHPDITTSARDGYYPVYLFSADLKRVYLSFALGVTQFERQYGRSKFAIEQIKVAAERARNAIAGSFAIPRLSDRDISLWNEEASWLSRGYEAGTIVAFPPYEIDELPSNEQLEEDFIHLIKLYDGVASDPTFPLVEELFLASVQQPQISEITMSDFRPRRVKKTKKNTGKGSSKRVSKSAKKIGDAGEKLVVEYEQRRLTELGQRDLVDKIVHHAAINEHPGWDITSFDEHRREIYIEVKSSIGKIINSIEITANEWAAAVAQETAKRYHIYLVTDVYSNNPTVEILRDPSEWVNQKKLFIIPSVLSLSLVSMDVDDEF